ncbi:MAG: hypothetical protein Q8T08_05565 [Ignavibacteria bacterium]|nr:hypothetical protein [Ignavibacteria bacterium]
MSDTNKKHVIPEKIASSVRDTLYYYGNIADISEDKILSICNALSPYYPLGDKESVAALTLREWIQAKEVQKISEGPFTNLRELVVDGVKSWKSIVERAYYDNKERQEHRHSQEKNSEMGPDYLYKELSYKLGNNDPRAIIQALEKIIERAIGNNQYFIEKLPQPNVNISPELITATQLFSENTQTKLNVYISRVAEAKQTLLHHIYQIVSVEEIYPVKKS